MTRWPAALVLVGVLVLPGCTVAVEGGAPSAGATASRPPEPPPPPRSFSLNCALPHDDLPHYGEIVGADFGREAEALVRVPPTYPAAAREAGVQGAVETAALVCPHGRVLEVRVEKSIPELDEAAMTAMSQWTFQPAQRDGRPIASWVRHPIRFSLH